MSFFSKIEAISEIIIFELRKSSEWTNPITSPVAKFKPLFKASYTPLSFSEINLTSGLFFCIN